MTGPRFQLPEAAEIGALRMADGADIRIYRHPHPAPRANLLVLTGRADFLEKWADALTRLHGSGFAVAAFDWRGQGGSTRLVKSGAGHIDRFETWLDDLDRVSDWALAGLPSAPWLALGHSMGAHLLTRWLADPARRGLAFRKALRGAVLASPFYGLGGSATISAAMLTVARAQVARGLGAQYAWGQKPYGAHRQAAKRQLLLTASDAHFEDEALWAAARPELATGGVSWGWLAGFADSEAALEALPLEALDLPVMMLLAGKERLVDNRRAMAIAARIPHAERHVVPGAAHELLREAEPALGVALAKIVDFADRVCR